MNLVAALAAGVVSMVIGAIWYSPAVFGKIWMREIGMKETDAMAGSGMAQAYGITFVGALLMGYVTAVVVHFAGASTAMEGLEVGLLLWLGFAVTIPLNDVVFGKKTTTLYMLNAAYYLVVLGINGILLALWK